MHLFAVALLILLSSLTASAQGWEWLNPLPQGFTISDLEYLGQNQLLAVTENSTSLSSTDGGETWTLVYDGQQLCPSSIDFVSATDGWGITDYYYWDFDRIYANTVFRTTDGGQCWEPVFHNPHVSLLDLSFPSSQNGWVVGVVDTSGDLAVVHTSDGGLTWSETVLDSGYYSALVCFVNDQEGWISTRFHIHHTTDGGETWDSHDTPYWMYFDLFFVDSQHGWGASFNDVYRTTDAGMTWLPSSYFQDWPRAVFASDADHVWAVAGGTVYSSVNGGQTWSPTVTDSTVEFAGVRFIDPQLGWIYGDVGTLYQTTNGGTTWTKRCGDRITNGTTYLFALDFADHFNGWMVGGGWPGYVAQVYHSTDGGEHWNVQYVDTAGSAISELEVLSATNIWAAGSSLIHSTDGGATWTHVPLEISGEFLNIECVTDQIIWVASNWDTPTVHRSLDGGQTWESHPVQAICKYSDMFVSDADNVWVTSYTSLDDCPIAHSSDGGVTWVNEDSLGVTGSMFFLDAMHGWALGWPHLLRTTDGGTTWIPIGTDTLWGASSIQFLDTMNGWVAGNEIAAHTTDGGVTWQRYDPHTYSNSMDFVDPAYGWVQGGCSVLRFDGSIFSAPDAPPPAPSSFALLPAYPNPFNSVTNLTFELPSASRAKVELFDISGRLVQTISDRQYTAGVHTIQFDAGPLPSGLYFARASSGEFHAVQKLVLLK